MPAAEVTVSDVLNHLDEVVSLTKKRLVPNDVFSPAFMVGYLRGLTDFRRYVRSSEFIDIVRTTKETPKHAHRS